MLIIFRQADEIRAWGIAMVKSTKAVKKRGPVTKRKSTITIQGKKTVRGERMTEGPYRLLQVKGARIFVGTLVGTINRGKTRLAIFSVPKG